MVTGAVAQNVSLLARITLYNKKGHRIRDVLKFNSATRIRTWKMLESESSALPFGDSPSYVLKYTTYNVLRKPFAQAPVYYITLETKKQVFFLEYSAS